MPEHFCSCPDHKCPFNPHNEAGSSAGCDLCIKKCLKAHEIPSCFFIDVNADTSGVSDYSYAGFAQFLKRHRG